MLRRFALSLAAATALSTTVLAADLPMSVPAALPAAPAYSWTGFYVGANLGYGWDLGDIRYTGDAGIINLINAGIAPGAFNINGSGALGGLQLGYNLQVTPNIVVGIEGDIQLANIEGSAAWSSTVGAGSSGSVSSQIDWFGTLRGRIGFAFDRVLVYGTGGLAFGQAEVSGRWVSNGVALGAVAIPTTIAAGSTTETRFGWTLGAGVEWAFAPNISIKGEYLYVDLGRTDLTLGGGIGPVPFIVSQRHDLDFHVVRLGVNVRF